MNLTALLSISCVVMQLKPTCEVRTSRYYYCCSFFVFAVPATEHLRPVTASLQFIVSFARYVRAGILLYPRRRATHHPRALHSSRFKQQWRVDALLGEDKARECRCFRATVGWRVVRPSALQAHHRRRRSMNHHRERKQTRRTMRSPGRSQKLGMWCATRVNGRAIFPSER